MEIFCMIINNIITQNADCRNQSVLESINQYQVEHFLESQARKVILSSVEVDFDGKVYRVWRDTCLLGTIKRDYNNGLWICQPCGYSLEPRFKDSDDAILFIVEITALTAK
jgi:hypothetical protein